MEKIVILLSTYNGESFLDFQLESLYLQKTNIDINLYVRDDGSTDKTVEIIKSWEEKLNIIWEESNNNLKPALSFWKLLESAPDADYYAFCDQDDYWYPNKIQMAIDSIKAIGKEKVLYCGNSRLVDEKGDYLAFVNRMQTYRPKFNIVSQMICGEGQGCTMVMDKALRKILVSMNLKHVPSHDWICVLYSIALGKVIYDSRYCMDYRQHNDNVVSKANKSIYRRLKQKYKLWYVSSRGHSNGDVAEELAQKCKSSLDEETLKFLHYLSEYRSSFHVKIKILFKSLKCENVRAVLSFKVRILLNMF